MLLGTEVNAVYRNMDVARTELYFAVSFSLFFPPHNFSVLGLQASAQPKGHYFPCTNQESK